MQFALLGPLAVDDGAGLEVKPAGARLRVLLAALLMSANLPVSPDVLAEAVWDGRPPPGAEATLRSHVKRLRRALGPGIGDRIVHQEPGYLIRVDPHELDVLQFESLCRDADAKLRAASWREASEAAASALQLWRGAPLMDVPSEVLREEFVPRFDQLRLQVLEDGIEAGLHLGHHDQMLAKLRELAGRYPLRERFRAQLMLALVRAGRQGEALEAYRDARRVLAEQVGVEPGPELRQLHERILAGDDELVVVVPLPSTSVRASPPAPSGAPVPRQLPAGVRHFTGRQAELDLVTSRAGATRNENGTTGHSGDGAAAMVILTIDGMAGVGKTALAVHWAHQYAEHYPDGQLYVNLRGFDPRSVSVRPEQAVRGFIDALGVPAGRIPAGLEEQSALYRSLVADRRMLVVLDNARDAEQVRPLLPGSSGCLVLITSRNRLTSLVAAEGARPLRLDVLSRRDARDLLVARLGSHAVSAEDQAASELVDLCARLPLALNIATAHAGYERGRPLGALVDRLRELSTRLDVLNGGDPATDVRAVFERSYQALSESAARLFRLLGLYPGTDITAQVAGSLADLSAPATRTALAELLASNILTEHEPARYVLHDLLRAFAVERCDETDPLAERQKASRQLLTWYLDASIAVAELVDPHHTLVETGDLPRGAAPLPRFADLASALAWGRVEQSNLAAAVACAAGQGADEHAWRLAVTLKNFYNRTCQWGDWQATHEVALASARRIGDRYAQGQILMSMGQLSVRIQQIDQGIELVDRAGALLREVGDGAGEATASSILGNAHMMAGNWEEAAARFETVVEMQRKSGYRRGEGVAMTNLSACLRYLGRYDEAEEAANSANTLNSELGNKDSLANGILTLMYVALARGEVSAAFTHVNEAMRLRREIGDRFGEAWALNELAEVHLAADDREAAIAALTKSEVIFAELYPDQAERQHARIEQLRSQPVPENA